MLDSSKPEEHVNRPSRTTLRSRSSSMTSTAKGLLSGAFHGHHLLHRSSTYKKQPKGAEEEAAFNKRREEEKHFIAQWGCDVHRPLTPGELSRSPQEKKIGNSSKHLCCQDFKMQQIVGTGTFARVWLAKLNNPQTCDKDKVFAVKVLRKYDVVKLKQVEHVENERSCLAGAAGHPFVNTLVATFQDQECLYMILDYCPGGEVFTYLRRARRFPEPTAQFYAAEVCLVFEYLHDTQGVAYRDLKPENILIDADGHLKIVDFGFAKKMNGRATYTLCGTPEYLAPESIRNSGHGTAVDWWAFGILIFEFLLGQPPFWDKNPMKIYEQIVRGHIKYPSGMSPDAQDIISKLCQVDPAHRLGNLSGGAKDVKKHPWFKDIDFEKLYRRELEAPIKPHLSGPADTRNFDYYEDEPHRKSRDEGSVVKKHDHMFTGF